MGYRSILNTIHQNHQHIPFTPNIIQQFHGEMYKFTSVRAGKRAWIKFSVKRLYLVTVK